jgi:hypothetical protein
MNDPDALGRRNLAFGWYGLLCFTALGAALEVLHAFKVGFYVDVDAETRRLMWRLAHAHGALLALVNIGFSSTLPHTPLGNLPRLKLASSCLIVAALLLPLGFFLGGVFASAGDPGLPVLLVPVGALLLVVGIAITARSLR